MLVPAHRHVFSLPDLFSFTQLRLFVRSLAIRHLSPARALRVAPCYGTFIIVIPFFFFLFGICIGSFLNVCISRIPEGISIVSPASRCPRCKTPIKPYDNVPILGWLWLRGKCRSCGLPISPMYPIIEFLTGALFVLTYYSFGISLVTLKFFIFGCLLIILMVTDLRVRLLPDVINWTGFAVGVAFATRIPTEGTAVALSVRLGFGMPPHPAIFFGVLDSLLGAAFGSFFLWGFAYLYKTVRKREGMGMGDVKMMAMVGAFLGVRGAFLTIFFGTLIGSILGLLLVALLYIFGWKKRVAERANRRGLGKVNSLRWAIATQYQLPLGTFLGIAALFVVYAWPPIVSHFAY
jgi:leader peptidase (prepilin peptidase) / N-methyltransferase